MKRKWIIYYIKNGIYGGGSDGAEEFTEITSTKISTGYEYHEPENDVGIVYSGNTDSNGDSLYILRIYYIGFCSKSSVSCQFSKPCC